MRERLRHDFGITGVLAGTYHAVCLRFLKTHGHLVGLPSLTIIDANSAQRILNGLLKTLPLTGHTPPKHIAALCVFIFCVRAVLFI